MLKPNDKKVAEQTELAALVAAYKAKGGKVDKVADGVSSHLRKRIYLRKRAAETARVGLDLLAFNSLLR